MGSVLLIIFWVTETVLALASDFVGYSGLFPPKAKNRETEVSGFRFFFLSLTLFEAIINENNLH